jgi:adenine-specific DNA-methyltransferase
MIKYLGSKRTLVPLLVDVALALGPGRTALDLFSGTSRVGHGLKRAGFRVLANDHNAYAAVLARCYVAADAEDWTDEATRVLDALRHVPGRAGWFTERYAIEGRFFQPENAARIEAIREEIARMALDPTLEAIALVSLLEAADRVDSTTGVQMAYLKSWARRSHNPLALRLPALLPATHGKCEAHQRDALDAATQLDGDVAYLDPPYNQHKYLSNYHIWETLVRWDQPAVYGTARKRMDCRTQRSDFNRKPRAADAMRQLIAAVRTRDLVVSFSDEGYLSRDALVEMLATRGDVVVICKDFPRYVGARIGIFNPQGEKVGKIGQLRNTEMIFVASPDAAAIANVRDLVRG